MPQFISPSTSAPAQLADMSVILVALALIWYTSPTLLIGRLRPLIVKARAWIDRAAGVALIGLGIRLTFESRPS